MQELQQQEVQRLQSMNAVVTKRLVEYRKKKEAEANRRLEEKKKNEERIRIEHLRRVLGPRWYFFGNLDTI